MSRAIVHDICLVRARVSSVRAKRTGAKRAPPKSSARRGVWRQGWQKPAQRRGTGKKMRLGFVAGHSLEATAYVI
jgi:hypothetical protein